ncbi:MAG: YbaN family protein [Parvularculaceae bacterium]|nr:YbaN family protein [Parvularculaceae bacterium]
MSDPVKGRTRRIVFRSLGLFLTAIGAAGVFLPLLPGVPFLILAAACFARSSPRLETWLLDHPLLGPGVRRWRDRGAITLRSKLIALSMMAASALLVTQTAAPGWAKIFTFAMMGAGALFVATRPGD